MTIIIPKGERSRWKREKLFITVNRCVYILCHILFPVINIKWKEGNVKALNFSLSIWNFHNDSIAAKRNFSENYFFEVGLKWKSFAIKIMNTQTITVNFFMPWIKFCLQNSTNCCLIEGYKSWQLVKVHEKKIIRRNNFLKYSHHVKSIWKMLPILQLTYITFLYFSVVKHIRCERIPLISLQKSMMMLWMCITWALEKGGVRWKVEKHKSVYVEIFLLRKIFKRRVRSFIKNKKKQRNFRVQSMENFVQQWKVFFSKITQGYVKNCDSARSYIKMCSHVVT